MPAQPHQCGAVSVNAHWVEGLPDAQTLPVRPSTCKSHMQTNRWRHLHTQWSVQMDTRTEGFEVDLVDESDITVWEAKLWLQEGSLATDLRQYARCWPAVAQTTRLLQRPVSARSPIQCCCAWRATMKLSGLQERAWCPPLAWAIMCQYCPRVQLPADCAAPAGHVSHGHALQQDQPARAGDLVP